MALFRVTNLINGRQSVPIPFNVNLQSGESKDIQVQDPDSLVNPVISDMLTRNKISIVKLDDDPAINDTLEELVNGGGGAFEPPVHGRILGVGTVSYQKGISGVIAIGTGHHQINLVDAIPENEMTIIVTPESGTPRMFGSTPINDSSVEIRSWDAAGVAANMNYRITIFQSPLS